MQFSFSTRVRQLKCLQLLALATIFALSACGDEVPALLPSLQPQPETEGLLGDECNTDEDCMAELRCNALSWQCKPPAPLPNLPSALSSVDEVDLGRHEVGPEGSEFLSVEVPEDALSLTLIADSPGAYYLWIDRVEDPAGKLPVNYDSDHSPVKSLGGSGAAVVQIPTSLRAKVNPGRYRFTVKSMSPIQTHLYALIKRGPKKNTGILNINCFLVGLPGLSANNAATHPEFQASLERVKLIYAQAGIIFGKVSYIDILGDDAAEFTVINSVSGVKSELNRMFQLSAKAPSRALNLFFVQEIQYAMDKFTILGIAGGAPGAGSLHGTEASGVAVTVANFSRSAENNGHVIAHEGGHYLGLKHVSESHGQEHDQIADTAECWGGRDGDQDGFVMPKECKGFGASNLMFWKTWPKSPVQLSPTQSYVMRRNPLVH
jgi:hypothetical protein